MSASTLVSVYNDMGRPYASISSISHIYCVW